MKDGYPREVAQGIQFENEINPCALVIYFEVSDDVMTARLMNRGKLFRAICAVAMRSISSKES